MQSMGREGWGKRQLQCNARRAGSHCSLEMLLPTQVGTGDTLTGHSGGVGTGEGKREAQPGMGQEGRPVRGQAEEGI